MRTLSFLALGTMFVIITGHSNGFTFVLPTKEPISSVKYWQALNNSMKHKFCEEFHHDIESLQQPKKKSDMAGSAQASAEQEQKTELKVETNVNLGQLKDSSEDKNGVSGSYLFPT
jgi:hypothetical protein